MGNIQELARLGRLIHDGVANPSGIEHFLRLDDADIKELLKELNDFYQFGKLSDWKTYYFARLCLHYLTKMRKESKKQ